MLCFTGFHAYWFIKILKIVSEVKEKMNEYKIQAYLINIRVKMNVSIM